MPKNEPDNKGEENVKKAAPEEFSKPQGGTPSQGVTPSQGAAPLDFTSFILSLSTSVLMHLGVVENPMTKMKEKEPLVARQTIDLITLLKEKTKGNLTAEEARLVDDVLHELHLWYVKEAQ